MNMPSFTAEASLYQTNNHFQSAGGNFPSDGNTTVTPQACGWIKGGICGTVIAGGIVVCTASCLASAELGGFPCYLCWAGFLGAAYGYCKDCIPAWMRALIDSSEGGGGGGGSGPPTCCPRGTTCKCGGRCVTNSNGTISCVGGTCLRPNQQCP
jgi:hypothetical protein